jgi:hypothetical protein
MSLGPAPTSTEYRVKFTGFKTTVTPDNFAQLFGVDSRNCYVDRKNDRAGYVVKIKTMKYAKQLIIQWHNKDIDGQKIKCQLELNPRIFAHPNRARSPARSIDEEPKHRRFRSRSRDARSPQSSQETSDLEDKDNGELDKDRGICGNALNGITQTLAKTNLHHANSSESITTGIDRKCKFLFLRD